MQNIAQHPRVYARSSFGQSCLSCASLGTPSRQGSGAMITRGRMPQRTSLKFEELLSSLSVLSFSKQGTDDCGSNAVHKKCFSVEHSDMKIKVGTSTTNIFRCGWRIYLAFSPYFHKHPDGFWCCLVSHNTQSRLNVQRVRPERGDVHFVNLGYAQRASGWILVRLCLAQFRYTHFRSNDVCGMISFNAVAMVFGKPRCMKEVLIFYHSIVENVSAWEDRIGEAVAGLVAQREGLSIQILVCTAFLVTELY